ncbi:MAG: hypothetical protein OEP52_01720 [Acidimicrobiia bacterium]|nr:hypothetical protein [Acidimicrobiia bacterium]
MIGILLYLLVGILYLGSGLVMPYPWAFGMWVLWIGGLIMLIRVFQDHRAWTPLGPVGAVILWVVIVQLGAWLFNWTA